MSELNRLTIEDYKATEKLPLIIVLDNIRSQNNIGSVFRTADSFRVQSIYLCGITATPPHREIHKTALGATESVEWRYFSSTADALEMLHSESYTILAVEQTEGSIPLNRYQPDPGKRLAVVFGNEVNGIEDAALSYSDACLEIPQFGTKHSLNVSVAVGIVIWDLFGKIKINFDL